MLLLALFVMIVAILATALFLQYRLKNTKEHYTSNPTQDQMITQAFQIVFMRPPYDFELQQYQIYTNVDDIVAALKTTPEYTALNTVNTPTTQEGMFSDVTTQDDVALTQRLETQRKIIVVYEQNLDRLPNIRELNYYTWRALTDSTFDENKLETLLQSSKEYKILQKNQTNQVNEDLPGNMTDAQLTYKVRTIYNEVYSSLPEKEMEEFLKRKFVDYQLNEIKLKNLLQLLKAIDNNDVTLIQNTNGTTTVSTNSTAVKQSLNNLMDNVIGPYNTANFDILSTITQNGSTANTNTDTSLLDPSTTVGYKTDWGSMFSLLNPTSDQLMNSLSGVGSEAKESTDNSSSACKTCSQQKQGTTYLPMRSNCENDYSKYKYKDPLYEALSKRNSCDPYDQNALEKNLETRDRDLLADYTTSRNMESLMNSCSRNTYFLNVDEEMNSAQQQKLPQSEIKPLNNIKPVNYSDRTLPVFGTFLEDAVDTKVGSIMPKFVYKEFP